jgi:hypothetical protein
MGIQQRGPGAAVGGPGANVFEQLSFLLSEQVVTLAGSAPMHTLQQSYRAEMREVLHLVGEPQTAAQLAHAVGLVSAQVATMLAPDLASGAVVRWHDARHGHGKLVYALAPRRGITS